ncbi:MAG: histidine kinase [Clostridiales bacterium]|nr:histidine kinase [Clostridiales bacterium]
MMTQAKANRGGRRFGISARVVVLTLAFTIVIAAIVLCSSLYYLSIQTSRTYLQAAEYQLETAVSSLSQRVEEIDSLANWCTANTTVRNYMMTSVSSNLATTLYPTVEDKYNSVSTANYIQRLLIYSTDGASDSKFIMLGTATSQSVTLTEERLRLLAGLDEADTAWETLRTEPLMQYGTSMQGIPVTASATSVSGRYTLKAYISVSPAIITDVMKRYVLDEDARLYWFMGGTVYQLEGDALIPLPEDSLQLAVSNEDAGATLDDSTLLYRTELDGVGYSVIAIPIGAHDLYLAEAIPDVPLSEMLPQLLNTIAIMVIAILFFGVLLMLVLHKLISKPIRALQLQIETLAQGDFTVNPGIEWNHELGDVGRGINHLSQNITSLMDKRVEDEKKRLDLEYQMLQSQINPHFIYNTLNSIKWMASIQHALGIAEMVTALARLLKSVSKSTQRLVPLEQELSLLEDYFTIERYRYGGTITAEVQCETEAQVLTTTLIPSSPSSPWRRTPSSTASSPRAAPDRSPSPSAGTGRGETFWCC